MMKGACPRADLLSTSAEQQKMRSMVARLPKYCTFDHTFHALRAEERYWFLKTKPIRHESRTPIEQYMALSAVMRVSIILSLRRSCRLYRHTCAHTVDLARRQYRQHSQR
eukprot:Protomagalhaensia_wolfi_Nauph_80__944@NODE_1543_length_1479_cov_257_174306_g1198_i0_p2_GENE_NODE_1543_length_1479_cov_257_174306_g1198_i0NODE_1543_length_1479_cov_257_174306_g1198_i0_p2_ORF_typecomplete_len110_score0_78_NODE_1543_length_1479_cov_257_174306_g1198_i0667996